MPNERPTPVFAEPADFEVAVTSLADVLSATILTSPPVNVMFTGAPAASPTTALVSVFA